MKDDLISRQAAIDSFRYDDDGTAWNMDDIVYRLEQFPSAQPEQDREFIKLTVRNSNGRPYYSIIYLEFDDNGVGHDFEGYSSYSLDVISDYLKKYFLPSAQPERTCVNCGRTANNGGWYADGGTRCPIEEHYALPKDGYCHLWEKRNVTDDDYPERRTDERFNQQTGGD